MVKCLVKTKPLQSHRPGTEFSENRHRLLKCGSVLLTDLFFIILRYVPAKITVRIMDVCCHLFLLRFRILARNLCGYRQGVSSTLSKGDKNDFMSKRKADVLENVSSVGLVQ